MKEVVEFRINNHYANLYLPDDVGERLGAIEATVRKVLVDINDPLYERIRDLTAFVSKNDDKLFYFGWNIYREYTKEEIESAVLFRVKVTSVFEPPGEDCGTVYDVSGECSICHAGRKRSQLILDLRKAPKTRQISRTIADDEIIISQELAEVLMAEKMTGFELRPVQHKAKYADDAIDLIRYPSGRELLRQSDALGIERNSWNFTVWLNKPEQDRLWNMARAEHAALKRGDEKRRAYKPLPVWYELVVTSKPLEVVSQTRSGIEVFDDDVKREYSCPLGHVLGLNLLSELFVSRESWDGSDIMFTRQMTGWQMGYLVPAPELVVSKRAYDILKKHKIKGYRAEITHLM